MTIGSEEAQETDIATDNEIAVQEVESDEDRDIVWLIFRNSFFFKFIINLVFI